MSSEQEVRVDRKSDGNFGRAGVRVSVLTVVALASGCGTLGLTGRQVEPLPPAPPEVPQLTGVPHPTGLELGDLRALFADPSAPSLESNLVNTCDVDIRALYEKTPSLEERKRGLGELVLKEPVRYHWCFYSKLLRFQSDLKRADYVDEKQKTVVEYFNVLAPLARAFKEKFEDSRYLRWAVREYRIASEKVFYRSVSASPQLTLELVGQGGDAPAIPNQPVEKSSSVLEKYGIVVPERTEPSLVDQAETKGRGPASSFPAESFD